MLPSMMGILHLGQMVGWCLDIDRVAFAFRMQSSHTSCPQSK